MTAYTPQLELFLKPLASTISHPSSNINTGSKLINAVGLLSSLSTYKTLQSKKSSYLYNIFNLQANTSTHLSTVITLQHPPVDSRLKIAEIFHLAYHAPVLWNSLLKDLRYPISNTSSTYLSHSTNHHLLALYISVHSKLKTHLFHQSFLPYSLFAPLYSRFSGSFNLPLYTLISHHYHCHCIIHVNFICHMAYSIVP